MNRANNQGAYSIANDGITESRVKPWSEYESDAAIVGPASSALPIISASSADSITPISPLGAFAANANYRSAELIYSGRSLLGQRSVLNSGFENFSLTVRAGLDGFLAGQERLFSPLTGTLDSALSFIQTGSLISNSQVRSETNALTFATAAFGGLTALRAAPFAAEIAAPNVDAYVAGLYSKATPTSTNAGLFEVEQTGALNYRVVGGGTAVDIDGYAGTTIQEAKYVGNVANSPYIEGSNIPDFLRAKILTEQQSEFARLGAVISDPAVPFTNLNVLTNESKAVPYFQNLLTANQIPGKVIVVPTKVP